MARKFNQRVNVIPNSVRNLLVAITLLLATTFSANALDITTTGTTTTITIEGSLDDIPSDYCPYLPTGTTHLIINNSANHSFNMYDAFTNCASLKEVTIIGNVRSMYKAFLSCASLEKVTINGNVDVMNWTFEKCGLLQGVTINGNVNAMFGAFSGCASLQEVTIKGNVNSIKEAFYKCSSLKEITFTQITPPQMERSHMFEGAFYNVPGPVVVNLPFGADESEWEAKLIDADLTNFTIKLGRDPNTPRNKTNIGRINIKRGKLEIRPRK